MSMRERGMSLLETTLALAILASMSAGLFMAVRSIQDGNTRVLSDVRVLQNVDDGLSALAWDLRTGTNFSLTATNSLSFTPAGGGTAKVELGPAIGGDPRKRPLIYTKNGTPRELTRPRALINHNPERLTLQGASADGTVPLFSLSAGPPQRVTLTLVLQGRPGAPVRYVRTSVTRRN
ncbi:hypothetical protein D3C87_1021510 [compost metagenome]